MRERPDGFLSEEHIDHDSEVFDYIRELHELLWKIVREKEPGAGGRLDFYLNKFWPNEEQP